jgi:hypothetical protein
MMGYKEAAWANSAIMTNTAIRLIAIYHRCFPPYFQDEQKTDSLL